MVFVVQRLNRHKDCVKRLVYELVIAHVTDLAWATYQCVVISQMDVLVHAACLDTIMGSFAILVQKNV